MTAIITCTVPAGQMTPDLAEEIRGKMRNRLALLPATSAKVEFVPVVFPEWLVVRFETNFELEPHVTSIVDATVNVLTDHFNIPAECIIETGKKFA